MRIHCFYWVAFFLYFSIVPSLYTQDVRRKNIGYGRNVFGELGLGDRDSRFQNPVQIGFGNLFGDVEAPFLGIWAGLRRSFILDKMGNLFGFGSNGLCGIGSGDATTISYSTPILLKKFKENDLIVSIACQYQHTLVLSSKGEVFGFGNNFQTQLGMLYAPCSSSDTGSASPAGIVCEPNLYSPSQFDDSPVVDIATGETFSLALTSENQVYGVGTNEQNEFQGGSSAKSKYYFFTRLNFSDNSNSKEAGFRGIRNITAGRSFSLFTTMEGSLIFSGHIHCVKSQDSYRPKSPTGEYGGRKMLYNATKEQMKVKMVTAGATHFFGMLDNGTMFGFGCNDYGVLQRNTSIITSTFQGRKGNPYFIYYSERDVFTQSFTPQVAKKIVAGEGCTGILTEKGEVYTIGRLGESRIVSTPFFTQVWAYGRFVDIGFATDHAVMITEDGLMYSMGDNSDYQTGTLPAMDLQPLQTFDSYALSTTNVVDVALSDSHVLALGIDPESSGPIPGNMQSLYVIGANSNAELGLGPFGDNTVLPYRNELIAALLYSEKFNQIVRLEVGLRSSFLLTDGGAIFSVGSGVEGTLGFGNGENKNYWTKVPMSHFDKEHYERGIRSIKTTGFHVHALTDKNVLYSWGQGERGVLGMGEKGDMDVFSPTLNPTLKNKQIEFVVPGPTSVVAVGTNRESIWEWGAISVVHSTPLYEPQIVDTTNFDLFHHEGKPFISWKIVTVAVGDSFGIIIVRYERPENKGFFDVVFCWGSLPFWESYAPKPILLEDGGVLPDGVVLKTCEAIDRVICVSKDGQLWGFGKNEYKQLSPFLSDPYVSTFQRIPIDYTAYGSITKDFLKIPSFSRVTLSTYSTILQEYVHCNGILDSEEGIVCSGHGICIANNTCKCFRGWGTPKNKLGGSGSIKNCSIPICYDESIGVTEDCSGHGTCYKSLKCSCESGWSNTDPNGEDDRYGYCRFPHLACLHDQPTSIHPTDGTPFCNCSESWKGEFCSLLVCNGEKDPEKTGCYMQSSCTDSEGKVECKCSPSGLANILPLVQDDDKKYGCVLDPFIFSVEIIVVLSFICCIIGCCCCIFVGFLTFSFGGVSCSCICCGLCVFCESCFLCFHFERARASRIKKKVEVLEGRENIRRHKKKFFEYKSPYHYFCNEEEEEEDGEADTEQIIVWDDLGEENEVEESSRLLRSRDMTLRLGEQHVFKGNPENGIGTIFYSTKTGDFPVFKGRFVNGKRDGYGVEFRAHYEKSPVDMSFFTDPNFFKFAGHFKNDYREGKGTEYDENGKEKLVGEYVKDMLIRILGIDYPLKVINLSKDIEYNKEVEEFLGGGGFAKIVGGKYRTKEGEVKEVAVKFFKDVLGLAASSGDSQSSSFSSSFGERKKKKRKKRKKPLNIHSITWKNGANYFEERIRALEYRRIQRSVSDVLKILSMFHHPNIIEIYGWSGPVAEMTRFGYVMEKCVCSVRQRYHSTTSQEFGMKEKIMYLYQTALAMKHVHHVMGLIHRDLKWGNVLIDNYDQVKICDFDMANRDELSFSSGRNIGKVQGSFWQMAPEILIEEEFDQSYDVYSYGIMMFELLFEKMDDPYELRSLKMCWKCGEPFELDEMKEKERLIGRSKKKLKSGGSSMGSEAKQYIAEFLTKHFRSCRLRPRIRNFELIEKKRENISEGGEEEEEDEEEEYGVDDGKRTQIFGWQLQLMQQCLETRDKRPSFNAIVDIFHKFHEDKKGVDWKPKKKKKKKRERVFEKTYHSIN